MTWKTSSMEIFGVFQAYGDTIGQGLTWKKSLANSKKGGEEKVM